MTTTYISLEQLCDKLNISLATGKNWLRLAKINAHHSDATTHYFSKELVEVLVKELQSGANTSLRSRRNKTFVTGNHLYKNYVATASEKLLQPILAYFNKKPVPAYAMQALLVECSLQYYIQSQKLDTPTTTNLLFHYLSDHQLPASFPEALILPLLSEQEATLSFINSAQHLFVQSYPYKPNEDFLGFLFQSLSCLGSKKKLGAYYTPDPLVDQLISTLPQHAASFLDPSCGTGNFLIKLAKQQDISTLYGYDIDPISIAITRINLALRCNCFDITILEDHFQTKNFLSASTSDLRFDCILGNPPWGASFSAEELLQLKKRYQCACNQGKPEIYDLFLEQATQLLTSNGHITFLLPEAILQVQKHQPIRTLICKNFQLLGISFLENAFYQVQCPSIILQLKKIQKKTDTTILSCTNAYVEHGQYAFFIHTKRTVTADNFSFLATDKEYSLLTSISSTPNCISLRDHATFSLGIVTGNNKKLLLSTSTSTSIPTITGNDVLAYQYNRPTKHLEYNRESLQQAAPLTKYQVPEKLIYRFIATYPIVAYDTTGALTLNSCNILVPTTDKLSCKYLLALLNSSLLRFYFIKSFKVLKILRSHLEQLPILIPTKEAKEDLTQIVDLLLNCSSLSQKEKYQKRIDQIVFDLYDISVLDRTYILKVLS